MAGSGTLQEHTLQISHFNIKLLQKTFINENHLLQLNEYYTEHKPAKHKAHFLTILNFMQKNNQSKRSSVMGIINKTCKLRVGYLIILFLLSHL